MQIIGWSGPSPAVAKVKIRGDVVVAIPPHSPTDEVLDLARLVLTGSEFEELRRRLGDMPGRAGGVARFGSRPAADSAMPDADRQPDAHRRSQMRNSHGRNP